MKKITEIFKERPLTFSFELFPPKTEKGYNSLLSNLEGLSQLKPDFISCTYGAGGGNREKTFEIVDLIQKKYQIPAIAHLTTVCHTKNELSKILKSIQAKGIINVLALRGDPPLDNPHWTPGPENVRYASELCAFIRENFKDTFCVGVAGFPEGHPQAPSLEMDRQFLQSKINNGADYVLTQLFFKQDAYRTYVSQLRERGINNRIIPGILPITNYQGLLKFCKICQTTLPDKVHHIFKPIQDDPQKTIKAGTEYAIKQGLELLDDGAPGLHFYTLNKLNPIQEILSTIRSSLKT